MSKKAQNKIIKSPIITSKITNTGYEFGVVTEKFGNTKCDKSIEDSMDLVHKLAVDYRPDVFTYEEYVNGTRNPKYLKVSIVQRIQSIINKVIYSKIYDRLDYQSAEKDKIIKGYRFRIGPTSIVNLSDIFSQVEIDKHFQMPVDAEKHLCLTEVLFDILPYTSKTKNSQFVEKVKIVVGFILPEISESTIGYPERKVDDGGGTEEAVEINYSIEEVTSGLGTSLVYTCRNKVYPFVLVDKEGEFEYIESDTSKKLNFNNGYLNQFMDRISTPNGGEGYYTMRFLCGTDIKTTVEDGVVTNIDHSYENSGNIYGLMSYIYETINTAIRRLGYVGINRQELEKLR